MGVASLIVNWVSEYDEPRDTNSSCYAETVILSFWLTLTSLNTRSCKLPWGHQFVSVDRLALASN